MSGLRHNSSGLSPSLKGAAPMRGHDFEPWGKALAPPPPIKPKKKKKGRIW